MPRSITELGSDAPHSESSLQVEDQRNVLKRCSLKRRGMRERLVAEKADQVLQAKRPSALSRFIDTTGQRECRECNQRRMTDCKL